jgi:hypothetical protein
MDFRIRGNAATLKFGRKLPGRDINDDLLHEMLLLLGQMYHSQPSLSLVC